MTAILLSCVVLQVALQRRPIILANSSLAAFKLLDTQLFNGSMRVVAVDVAVESRPDTELFENLGQILSDITIHRFFLNKPS